MNLAYIRETRNTFEIGNSKFNFKIVVLKTNGQLTILFNNRQWASGGYLTHHNGHWYSNFSDEYEKHSIICFATDFKVTSSTDRIGSFKKLSFILSIRKKFKDIVAYEIKVYDHEPVVQITLMHLKERNGVYAGKETEIIDAPLYLRLENKSKFHIFSYTSHAWIKPIFFNFENHPQSDTFMSSFISLFDKRKNTIIISAFNTFGNQLYKLRKKGAYLYLVCGLEGLIESIPAKTQISEILCFGTSFNETLRKWGTILRRNYNKVFNKNLDLIKYISYWTSPGAFYFYRTLPKKNYEETILEISQDLRRKKIPYVFFELDSWWYPKGENEGVLSYEPIPELPSGLKALAEEVGLLIANMRWFDLNTKYKDQFSFIDEKICFPTSFEIYDYLGSQFRSWGITAIVHDWLSVVRDCAKKYLMSQIGTLQNWMKNFAKAFGNNVIRVILSMPDTYHLFSSLTSNDIVVTRTGEGHSKNLSRAYSLWQNIYVSQLILSLGLFPNFDVFFTSSDQYRLLKLPQEEQNDIKVYPETESLARILMFSMFGIGDPICTTDKDLLDKVVLPEGEIIHPDEPAVPIFKNMLNDPRKTGEPLILKTTVHNEYILVAAFNVSDEYDVEYNITLKDLDLNGRYFAFEWFSRDTLLIESEDTIITGVVKINQVAFWILVPLEEMTPKIIGNISYFIAPKALRFEELYDEQKKQYILKLNLPKKSEVAIFSPERPTIIQTVGYAAEVKYEYFEDKKLLILDVPTQYIELSIKY